MALKIRWTKKAADSLEHTVNYIENEWGAKSTNKLIRNLNNFLTLVKQYPQIGKIEIVEKSIRGFVISRHNSILYRIKEQEIVILKFFDNRQNPRKKTL
jgi:plasmid stabilization system protein ParE